MLRDLKAMPEQNARATFEITFVHPQQAERIDDAILGVVSEQPGFGFDNEPLFTPTSSFTQQVQRQTGAESPGGGGETNQHLESTRDELHRHFFRSFSVSHNELFSARKHIGFRSINFRSL
jgi:hypothetical protein